MAKNVTALCAPKISNFLKNNTIVSTLDFPSLSRMKRTYHPCDYREAGRIIGEGKVEVYQSGKSGLASYDVKGNSSLTFGTSIDDDNRNGVVVHEVTHMIQDMRQLKMSILEMELDAYFAEALYHVRRGTTDIYEDTVPFLIGFRMVHIAQGFEDDESYFRTREFRRYRDDVGREIGNEYYHRHPDMKIGKRFKNDGLQL